MKGFFIVAIAVAGTSAAVANLVVNSDFESSGGQYTVGGQGLAGWTVLGASASDDVFVFGPTAGFGPQTNSVDLGGFSDVSGTGMEQVVPTVTGLTYNFNFDYWTGSNVIPGTIDVFVNGVQILDELDSGLDNLPRVYHTTFLASGPTTIKFLAGDKVVANDIDNVFVEAVPEPASFAILGLGALALIRNRRN